MRLRINTDRGAALHAFFYRGKKIFRGFQIIRQRQRAQRRIHAAHALDRHVCGMNDDVRPPFSRQQRGYERIRRRGSVIAVYKVRALFRHGFQRFFIFYFPAEADF